MKEAPRKDKEMPPEKLITVITIKDMVRHFFEDINNSSEFEIKEFDDSGVHTKHAYLRGSLVAGMSEGGTEELKSYYFGCFFERDVLDQDCKFNFMQLVLDGKKYETKMVITRYGHRGNDIKNYGFSKLKKSSIKEISRALKLKNISQKNRTD